MSDDRTTDADMGVLAVCPCQLHYLANHPRTYPWHPGTLSLFDCCWCECDHSADEARWAA